MADLSVTASSVVPSSTASLITGTAGETITAGMPVYLKASDSKIYKAIDSTAAAAAVVGVAVCGASANQPVTYATAGDITYNSIFTAGVAYYISDTAGGLRAFADQSTGDYVTMVGVATSATVLHLVIYATGITAA